MCYPLPTYLIAASKLSDSFVFFIYFFFFSFFYYFINLLGFFFLSFLSLNYSTFFFSLCRKRSELIIRSFNTSDAGRYECRAKNKVNRNIERRAIVIKAYPGIYSLIRIHIPFSVIYLQRIFFNYFLSVSVSFFFFFNYF